MIIPKSLNTITPFSKFLAMGLFLLFPILGFYLGMQYQQVLNQLKESKIDNVNEPTPTPKSTVNWKTYVNMKYKFSFKHPNLIEQTNYKPALAENYYKNHEHIAFLFRDKVSPSSDSISIEIALNNTRTTLEEYVKNASKNEYMVSSELPVTVGDQKGIMQISKLHPDDKEIDFTIYYITIPNDYKFLKIIKGDSTAGSFDKEFDQILSTFKFTN